MVDKETQNYLRGWIHNLATAGYDTLDHLAEIFGEVLDGENIDNHEPWLARLTTAWQEQVDLEKTWDRVTVNDKITSAFTELRNSNIIALENSGYTQSDGWEDIHETRQDFPQAIGAAFFHGQDVERGVAGQGLFIRFGSLEDKSKDGEIAEIVFKALKKQGIDVKWSGNPEETIQVLPFTWRRRNISHTRLQQPRKPWWKFWA